MTIKFQTINVLIQSCNNQVLSDLNQNITMEEADRYIIQNPPTEQVIKSDCTDDIMQYLGDNIGEGHMYGDCLTEYGKLYISQLVSDLI